MNDELAPAPDDSIQRQAWLDDVVSTVDGDLFRFLRARVGHPQLAEDLAQEVYLRLLRMDDVSLIRDPRAFVIRLAVHAVHEWRMLARNRMPHSSEILPSLVDPDDSPAERLERKDRMRSLSLALDTLSPKCRAVLLMNRRDGMTCQEIAQHMQLSVGMVKKHLARGLAACRRLADGAREGE